MNYFVDGMTVPEDYFIQRLYSGRIGGVFGLMDRQFRFSHYSVRTWPYGEKEFGSNLGRAIGEAYEQNQRYVYANYFEMSWLPAAFGEDTARDPEHQPLQSDGELRKSLVETLNNGNCRKFIDAFRQQAGITESTEEVFDKTVADGGFALAPDLEGTVGGRTPYNSKTYGNHPVGITPQSFKTDSYSRETTLRRYVRAMIHEILLHRTKLKDHKKGAVLAFDLQTPNQKSTNPLPKKTLPGFDKDDTYAIYFNGILFGECDPQYRAARINSDTMIAHHPDAQRARGILGDILASS